MEIPKSIFTVINQIYELERKLKKNGDPDNLGRNVGKMKDALAEDGIWIRDPFIGYRHIRLEYEDPLGQPCGETRTDLDVTLSGSETADLVVVEVIKPIIRAVSQGDVSRTFPVVVQNGVVIAQSRKEL